MTTRRHPRPIVVIGGLLAIATGFAGVLLTGLLLNWLTDPTRAVLERLDLAEYKPGLST